MSLSYRRLHTPRYFTLFTNGIFRPFKVQQLLLLITCQYGPHRKHHFSLLYLLVAVETCLFAKPLLSNGCLLFACSNVVAEHNIIRLYYVPFHVTIG
jgi:hypothetical protein